ncbi:hypothetical protein [Chitinimonas sp.]|uniref:hypothetical protein n=1 Tax=Chitinimonas sp. TaxID=1934313 RepID=UPI002F95F8E9
MTNEHSKSPVPAAPLVVWFLRLAGLACLGFAVFVGLAAWSLWHMPEQAYLSTAMLVMLTALLLHGGLVLLRGRAGMAPSPAGVWQARVLAALLLLVYLLMCWASNMAAAALSLPVLGFAALLLAGGKRAAKQSTPGH